MGPFGALRGLEPEDFFAARLRFPADFDRFPADFDRFPVDFARDFERFLFFPAPPPALFPFLRFLPFFPPAEALRPTFVPLLFFFLLGTHTTHVELRNFCGGLLLRLERRTPALPPPPPRAAALLLAFMGFVRFDLDFDLAPPRLGEGEQPLSHLQVEQHFSILRATMVTQLTSKHLLLASACATPNFDRSSAENHSVN